MWLCIVLCAVAGVVCALFNRTINLLSSYLLHLSNMIKVNVMQMNVVELYIGCSDITVIYGRDTVSMLWSNMAYCVKWEISTILLSLFVQRYFIISCRHKLSNVQT